MQAAPDRQPSPRVTTPSLRHRQGESLLQLGGWVASPARRAVCGALHVHWRAPLHRGCFVGSPGLSLEPAVFATKQAPAHAELCLFFSH